MDARKTWVAARVRWGWALLAAGVAAGAAGAIAEFVTANAHFNFRVVTAVGILLTALGVTRVVRYRAALKDETAARRAVASERDERALAIRANAGYRAYVASAAILYAGLVWSGLTPSGGLPALEGDVLWYYLAVAFVVPGIVYAGGIAVAEHRS